ncbi:PPOX class F420-dependent oxidoreductase [Gordonia sp. TBRC 11910]|uniref:PPOX class F420-dependent oxidoreductase n=1 Tax=Gordonia asplenii TaxID=2725283 RepID=A0A848KUD7_9ACTN|nr:PPOX class F420-dependent oxidoreductase [Gordonia asplenii]NMO02306.1 PPOX class F420-dependent oxidoreductase [Gordonia asplenii]
MLQNEIREVLDGTPIAHLATVRPDGSPHSVPVWIGTLGERVVFITGPASSKARNLRDDPRVAISLTPPDAPFTPVLIRGRVVEWIDGDAGWAIVDELAQKYIGSPYGRDQDRVALVVDVEHQQFGMA